MSFYLYGQPLVCDSQSLNVGLGLVCNTSFSFFQCGTCSTTFSIFPMWDFNVCVVQLCLVLFFFLHAVVPTLNTYISNHGLLNDARMVSYQRGHGIEQDWC